jgi:hypothetical protein
LRLREFSPYKPGFRVLGIAESFNPERWDRSFLAGVVMRADMVVDGFAIGECTVGGMDSTDAVVEMYRGLGREDINLVMLGGCIISLFNIVDLPRVSEETRHVRSRRQRQMCIRDSNKPLQHRRSPEGLRRDEASRGLPHLQPLGGAG